MADVGNTCMNLPSKSFGMPAKLRPFRLHWLHCQPTPYNDFLFRSLAADPAIDLTVHFIYRVLPSHPWKTQMAQGFHARYYKRVLGLDWYLLRQAALDRNSFFVIAGWNEPTVQLVINLLMLRRRPFAIATDTPILARRRSILKAFLRANWLRLVFRRTSYVLGTGQVAREALLQMGCPKEKFAMFSYFVDLDLFRPPSGMNSKGMTNLREVVFVSSGRLLNAVKGHDLALAAFAKVAHKDHHIAFRYRIAGSGPDAVTLHSQAQRLNLEQHVEFLEWIEPDQLPGFYHTGHVLLHPSRWEPYGVAVLEGMASGLPVIGSDGAGAVRDRIRHEVNGFVHHSEDVDSMARYISHFLAHPEDIARMGMAARTTAEEWPVSRGVQTIKRIVESCLGPGS